MNYRLTSARKKRDDEYYTRLCDIENEMRHYNFYGMSLYLNCDNPTTSNFWVYFHKNFTRLGIKKITATFIGNDAYKMEYSGGDDNNVMYGTKTPLEHGGDFRNCECTEILKGSDVVVTNPPFSLFRTFMKNLVEHEKKFIVLGNQNAVTYKEIFPLFRDNLVWYGVSIHSGGLYFYCPNALHSTNVVLKEGKECTYIDGCRWFTNTENDACPCELLLTREYYPNDYQTYDNYNAINVDRTCDIPKNYDGLMGVPVSFMNKYNRNQFKLVDYINSPKINGKIIYKRIIICLT